MTTLTTPATPATPATPSEALDARLARLALPAPKPARAESLALAHAAGASDDTLRVLATAGRLARKESVVVPAHRFEGLSRGRGWARKGKGNDASWGDRVDGGYRVGPGRWVVGGDDGYSRKGQDEWTVRHVTVGTTVWTIADRRA